LAQQPAINLKREEIRGMFVLGVLAILLALVSQPSLGLLGKLPLEVVAILYVVMLYWGLYVFFMAIGLSSDILTVGLAQWAAWIAHSLFQFSVIASLAIGGIALIDAGPFGFKIFLIHPLGLSALSLLWVLYFSGGVPDFIRYLLKKPRQRPTRGQILRPVSFIVFSLPLLILT
jgi:hypothetical protein